MIESRLNSEGLVVRSGVDVDEAALREFQQIAFPGWPITRIWRWLYRATPSGFPLVCLDGARVVGHAGGIPFTARVGERLCTAAWFVDFSVLPEYQRRGVGGRLTQAWMERSELCVTFCNDRSMAVFLRYGWIETFAARLHSIWLRPFDHRRAIAVASRALRAMGNRVYTALAGVWYAALADRSADLAPVDTDGVKDLFPEPSARAAAEISAHRNVEYWKWRIAASPDRANYRLYRGAGVTMLLSLSPKKRVDVLWMVGDADTLRSQGPRMLAALAVWGLRNGFVSIRYRLPQSVPERAFRLLGSAVTHPRFAFWTRDQTLRDHLRGAEWQWQLIDSDFEWL